MCSCPPGTEVGTYTNQVRLIAPQHMIAYKSKAGGHPYIICVDACLREEILHLWYYGITTTGCCCGHNILPPYIGVIDKDILTMKSLGYEVQPNSMDPQREDGFKPKSV